MRRISEPELMNGEEQARAYALADFTQPHTMFVELFRQRFAGEKIDGRVVDLGCGPGDVTIRFAKAYPLCRIDALDGAPRMLAHAREAAEQQQVAGRINWLERYLPASMPETPGYDAGISNSLLHHLAEPMVLWDTLKTALKPGAPVWVMDLLRPASEARARALVRQYADGEPRILQEDFFHSLCAAYRVEEVQAQLARAGLGQLAVEVIGDRHLLVSGRR